MSEPNVSPANGANNPAGDSGATGTLDNVAALQARVQAAEQSRDDFRALAQRTQADFENYQKRNQREREQERRYWHFPFAHDLLPALDNLERAIAAAKQSGEKGALAQGVAMVHSQLLSVLGRHGIKPIEALGKAFDPNLHQAVMQQPAADHPPGTVVQVLEPGYLIHERVLRPASVIVAAAPTADQAP